MKERRSVLMVIVTCCMVLIMVGGCGKTEQSGRKSKPAALVKTAVAETTNLVELIETTGDIVAVNTVTLEATVEGPIACCPWREGDCVERAGMKLIEIHRPLYRQELAAAEAVRDLAQAKLDDLKAGARPEEISQARETLRHFEDCTAFAEADLKRIRSLVASGTLPAEMAERARVDFVKCQTQLGSAREELAMLEAGPTVTEIAVAQAAVDEAESRVGLAQARLDECSLVAPFPGIITEVYVRVGDLATPRAKLLKMIDPTSLVVRTGLPESSSAHIRTGTAATVTLDAFSGQKFKARISRIYPRIEADSRTRIVEAELIDPVELLPRMFARIKTQGRVFDDAVMVPTKSITTTPRGQTVLFVVQDGKAVQRKVTTGIEQADMIQITEGLQAGEVVVTVGNLNLRDGIAIRVGNAAETGAKAGAAQSMEAENPEGSEA